VCFGAENLPETFPVGRIQGGESKEAAEYDTTRIMRSTVIDCFAAQTGTLEDDGVAALR
jgi:hypothetical protein